MRRNSKGLNDNLVLYLCKFSGVLYTMAIISSCNNDKKHQSVAEKQYMPTEGRGRNRGGSGSANKETLPSKKTPIDELTEKENNNETLLNVNAKYYSSSTGIYNNNNRKRKGNFSDKETLKTNKQHIPTLWEEPWNDDSSYSQSEHQSIDIATGVNYDCKIPKDYEGKLYDLFAITPVEDETCKDFAKMKSVCYRCGILLNYGETGDHHKGFPNDHLLLSIKDADKYVNDRDLCIFTKHLKQYKKFIKRQKSVLKCKAEIIKNTIETYKVSENIWKYHKNDYSLESIVKNYLSTTKDLELIRLLNQIREEDLDLFIDYIIEKKNGGKTVYQELIKELINLFLFDCSKELGEEFENITEIKVEYYEQGDLLIQPKNKSFEIIKKVKNNLKKMEQSIGIYKQQLEYIKLTNELIYEDYNDLLDDKHTEGLTVESLLKAFAFIFLKYTPQLEEIPLNLVEDYQRFYETRYLDNFVKKMIDNRLFNIQSDEAAEYIPVGISGKCNSKINSEIGESVDGYVAIFDNYGNLKKCISLIY